MKPADDTAATERQGRKSAAMYVSPRQMGGWIATLLAWGAVMTQPQDAAGAGLGRSLAITLTLVSVMIACYEGLRRGQRKTADRIDARLDAAISELSGAIVSQGRQIRRTRKRINASAEGREARAQESTDDLGARVQHLTDLIEASALLAEVRPQGPEMPRPVRLVPLQPHGS